MVPLIDGVIGGLGQWWMTLMTRSKVRGSLHRKDFLIDSLLTLYIPENWVSVPLKPYIGTKYRTSWKRGTLCY